MRGQLEDAVDVVVAVAEVLEQYNLCVNDVSGVPWKFQHEDFNHMIMTREEKKVDWRKRVSLCLATRSEVPHKQGRYHISEWQKIRLEAFLRNPFSKLISKQVPTMVWDPKYGGQRHIMTHKLSEYFEADRVKAARKIDSLFHYWRVYKYADQYERG